MKAQGEIASIHKDGSNLWFKSKYASLDAIIEALRPILSKHKLSVLQPLSEEGLQTVILHESGQWIASGLKVVTIPEEVIAKTGRPTANLCQREGTGVTYLKRYQLGAMFLISTDEDTDATMGQPTQAPAQMPAQKPRKKPVSNDKLTELIKWMESKNKTLKQVQESYQLTDAQCQAIEDHFLEKDLEKEREETAKNGKSKEKVEA